MGTLGDRIGRRRLLMIGAAAFGIASVLAAFSRSAETLILPEYRDPNAGRPVQLAETARTAFLRGLRLCAAISAAGSIALAFFAAGLLRRMRPG